MCASGKLGDACVDRADSLLKRACDLNYGDACAALARRMQEGERK